jgi:hypothetical protein
MNSLKSAYEKFLGSILRKLSDDDLDWFRSLTNNATYLETQRRATERNSNG